MMRAKDTEQPNRTCDEPSNWTHPAGRQVEFDAVLPGTGQTARAFY